MKPHWGFFTGALFLPCIALSARAEIKVVIERNQADQATHAFTFKNVPPPSNIDAAQTAKFEIVEGKKDAKSGDLDKLHDGQVPAEGNQPGENFYFDRNTDGGRILIDLGEAIDIQQINTYSWHTDVRGPQVYKLYGADGKGASFDVRPKRPIDPETAGWKLLASVDTRPREGEPGGQYGVSIVDSGGTVGDYRYLLFDIRPAESDDEWGNTFYSEIDVVGKNASRGTADAEPAAKRPALPDPAAVRKAAASIDALYHDELAKAPDPETKRVIAKTILQAAPDETDAATKYALYQKAIDLAVEAGDVDTATRGVDGLSRTWNVDVSTLMARTLMDLSRHLRSPEAQTELAHRMQAAAADALADGSYDGARDLINAASACARQGNDAALVGELSAQEMEITRIRSAHSSIAPWVIKLKKNPADPAANGVVSRFECLVAGNWDAGLRKLAVGSDRQLKLLAEKDLSAASAADQVAAGDGWWDFAREADELGRQQIERHAADLYRKAVDDLTGTDKLRVQQRIDLAARLPSAFPPGSALRGISLLNLTTAREASQILDEVLHDYPQVLKGVRQATLVRYHDGTQYAHGGGGTRRLPGSFSIAPMVADSKSFLFWNVYDAYEPGRYLIVSRIQPLSPPGTGQVADMDMYTAQGAGLAGHRLKPSEIEIGRWSEIPMVIQLTEAKKVDCRMYTNEPHQIALDRVYVFRLQE